MAAKSLGKEIKLWVSYFGDRESELGRPMSKLISQPSLRWVSESSVVKCKINQFAFIRKFVRIHYSLAYDQIQ